MLSAMRIGLPDGTDLELENGATGLDVANAIGPRLAQAAVAVGVGDEVRDLRLPLAEGDRVRILTARDAEALPVLRHSTAHVMAEAVLHLWPDAKVAIGPAIADGFYYDFQFPEPISSDALGRIELEKRRKPFRAPFVAAPVTASCAAVRSPGPPRAIRIFESVAYSFETSWPVQKKPKPFGMTIRRRCL